MYKYFFDYIFYGLNFAYYRISDMSAGLDISDGHLPGSDYHEAPGISILCSFQLLNAFTIFKLASCLAGYEISLNPLVVFIFMVINLVVNYVRYRRIILFMDLHEKLGGKKQNYSFSMTKIYCIASVVAFVLFVFL